MKIYIDMDGTLLDIFERYSGVFNLYINTFGHHITKEKYRNLRQSGVSEAWILEKKWGLSGDTEKYRAFRKHYLESREWLEKDTVIGQPEEIRQYPYDFALITQRYNRKEAIRQISRLQLDTIFDEIIVLEPQKGRNSKEEYLRGKVTEEDCIIGDSPVELECSRRLGMQGYFVKTGLFGSQIVQGEYTGNDYLECVEKIASC